MSKLVTCKTCEKEIAKAAKVCPHCGAKNAKSGWFLKALAAYIAIAIIWSLLKGPSVDVGQRPERAAFDGLAPMDYRAAALGQLEAGTLVALNGVVTQLSGGTEAVVSMGNPLAGRVDGLVHLKFDSKPQILQGDYLAIFGRYVEPIDPLNLLGDERPVPSIAVDYYDNVFDTP